MMITDSSSEVSVIVMGLLLFFLLFPAFEALLRSGMVVVILAFFAGFLLDRAVVLEEEFLRFFAGIVKQDNLG